MDKAVTTSALGILKENADQLTAYFRRILNQYADAPKRLTEAIEYSLLAGGKRLRPALIIESYRACRVAGRGDEKSAWAAAAAMELVHTFSLIHDNLPAMDNDDLRRGRLTNHKVYGEAMAILAGDAMVPMAFEIIARDAQRGLVPELINELATATGPLGMIGGQVLDMEGERKALGLQELQELHRRKTGALLTCSCRLGAISAGADEKILAAISDFGRRLGLAFQIVDDVLDVTSTPEQLGKATNKDAGKGKNTYPVLLGLDASKAEAAKELRSALEAIRPLGAQADGLADLAAFVVEREV